MTRRRLMVMVSVVAALIGPGIVSCAASSTATNAPAAESSAMPPADVSPSGTDPKAEAQAAAWLDAAALPPGAVPSSFAPANFNSFTGWVCQPVAQLEGFWTVPGMTVATAANWLIANPTADLVTTAGGPWPDDEDMDGVSVGYIPADGSHQGVVYTVVKTDDGVAIRAEVAALTDSAVCATPPDGGTWGAPGQG